MPITPNASSLGGDHVEATMFFLPRNERYKTEKPYTARYDPEGLFPPTNIEVVKHQLKIQNMRPFMQSLSYNKMGFQVAQLVSQMHYEDYLDPAKIQDIHIPEVEGLVKDVLGASRVHLLDFAIRRQHPQFPIATGQNYDYLQPTSRAHLDYTREYVRDIILPQLPPNPGTRWQCVNVWHPLKGPIKDWPLALCDASTVDFATDTMAGDVVERTAVFENVQVHYNPAHRWFYLPDQIPSEVMVFKNADSRSWDGVTSYGAVHSAFKIHDSAGSVRESIEIRLLVFWDDGHQDE